jgi:rare lipoprotein A
MMRQGRFMTVMVAAAAALSGCAEANLFGHAAKSAASVGSAPPPASSATSNYKIGKPYQVAGVWYYPKEEFDYDETGIASWYGPNFHAKLTANGEVFDQDAVSAAHKTLQLPCIARVTNLENGRSIVLRINDRGPFVNGRIIDLSRHSAQLLGMEGKGTARVRVQVIEDESRALAGKIGPDVPADQPRLAAAAPRSSVSAEALAPPPGANARPGASAPLPASPAASPRTSPFHDRSGQELATQDVTTVAVNPTNIYVQVGSFSRHDNAARLSERMKSVGKAQIQTGYVDGKTVYRVRLGPLASVEDADRLLDSVVAIGQQDARVVVD